MSYMMEDGASKSSHEKCGGKKNLEGSPHPCLYTGLFTLRPAGLFVSSATKARLVELLPETTTDVGDGASMFLALLISRMGG